MFNHASDVLALAGSKLFTKLGEAQPYTINSHVARNLWKVMIELMPAMTWTTESAARFFPTQRWHASTLNSTPSTLNSQPSTLNPQPSTPYPKP